jgi:hypothetical protein
MWEHTPASPDQPREVYLAAVERSEVVIWLVGSETSSPVRDEIELAARLGKRRLVFLLPVPARDAVTQQLLRDARGVVKWADVADEADLERQLSQALSDMLLRAVRGSPTLTRMAAAQALRGRLRGIALARWLAAGVPLDTAADLFADPNAGRLPDALLPTEAQPLRVLEGDVGSGKTLGAVRWLLDATRRLVEDPNAPLPVWIAREDPTADLRSTVVAQTRDMGDPWGRGLSLVVDGVDERTDEAPEALLDAVRELIHANPQSRGVVTSRPGLLSRDRSPELAAVPLMTADESAAMINRVFDVGIRPLDIRVLEQPIRDAVQRPLFALLLGRLRSDSALVRPGGLGQLIERLVVSAIGAEVADSPTSTSLMALARDSIDAGGRPIPARDLGDRRVADALLRSRLVIPVGAGLGFALPILREWFGAQSIERGLTSIDHVVASDQRLERWRYALYVAAATLPRDTVNDLLSAVSSRSPAVASKVIDQARLGWRPADTTAPPSALKLGGWYLRAIDRLSQGLGKAGSVIFPRLGRPRLPVLAVAGDEERFAYAWLTREHSAGDDLVEVQLTTIDRPPDGYLRAHYAAPCPDPVWPWSAARDELRGDLGSALKARAFFVEPMREEAAWLAANWLVRRGSIIDTPLSTEAVRSALARVGDLDAVQVRDRIVPLFPLREASLNAREFRCPYPERDEPLSSWIWSGYSDRVLLERTRRTYGVAVEIYDALVREWFSGLQSRLLLAQLLPARLVGTLHPGTRDGSLASAPGISYRWEPLPPGSQCRIEIELGARHRTDWAELDALQDRIRALRPHVSWLAASAESAVLSVFEHDPATSLAYDWLIGELRHLGWST